MSKLVDLYLNEKIDLTIYENKKNEYDLKISLLKKEDEALKKDNKYLNNEEAKNIVNRFDSKNISYDEQKKIVKMLINKIEVAPDKLTVYWNF